MTSSDIVKIEDLQALQTRSIDFVAPEGQCIELALMKKNVKIRSELKGYAPFQYCFAYIICSRVLKTSKLMI